MLAKLKMLSRAATRSFRSYGAPSRIIFSQFYASSPRPYSGPVRIFLPKSISQSYGKSRNYPPKTRDGQETERPVGPITAGTGPSFAASSLESSRETAPSNKNPIYPNKTPGPATTASPVSNPGVSDSLPDASEPLQQEQQSFHPLPDLTQGIPSTLDAELAQAASDARAGTKGLNVNEDPAQPAARGRGEGDFPKSSYISSIERRKSRVARYMYASFLAFAVVGTIYLGRNWETEEEEKQHPDAPSGWGFGLFYDRAHARLGDIMDYYNEPSFPKLLPNPDPTWERPYTLVLSLEDLLVHSEWSREHGWRMAKRPGVDYFLRYLNQYYELVIFTSVPSMIGEPIIKKLDPFRIVMWPLFREATRFRKGEYIKDLSYLNRDLKKVIMIDTVPSHAKLQPENAIILDKWKGSLEDKDLVSLIPFLEYVATMNIDDTREVIKTFEGKHIPTEFAKRDAIARERFQKVIAAERAKRPRRSGMAYLSNLLGIKPMEGGYDGMDPGFAKGFDEGRTLQDQIRERGQRQYEMLEKEIRENGDTWLAEMKQEEEKMKEEAMKGMKTSVLGTIGLGGSQKGA